MLKKILVFVTRVIYMFEFMLCSELHYASFTKLNTQQNINNLTVVRYLLFEERIADLIGGNCQSDIWGVGDGGIVDVWPRCSSLEG